MFRGTQTVPHEPQTGVEVGTGPVKTLPVTLAYKSYCFQPPHFSAGPPTSLPKHVFVQAFDPTKLVGIGVGASVAAKQSLPCSRPT